MTLGLAFATADQIFLGIESQGLPCPGPELRSGLPAVMISKILFLQKSPEVAVLTAGGLDHWAEVYTKYTEEKKRSVTEVANELARLLDACMNSKNQAFGLVCGFEESKPNCIRLNREVGSTCCSLKAESLDELQGIGMVNHANAARDVANAAMGQGMSPGIAILQAIKSRLPSAGHRLPIHLWTIEKR